MTDYNLDRLFEECLGFTDFVNIKKDVVDSINLVVKNSEKQKGVLTVIITGLIYKYYHPEQDVRYHQSNLPRGYSGRSFDTKYVTPFLRKMEFPSMAESGWLTRSLEQNIPYDSKYTGSIAGNGVKEAFLNIYKETQYGNSLQMLAFLFKELVNQRDLSNIELSIPSNLTVEQTLNLIQNHINHSYQNARGASRLPSLAIYSAYKEFVGAQQGRYKGKNISDLNSHTASDRSTGSIGDIQINFNDGRPFEGLEIKAKKIDTNMIDLIYKKVQNFRDIERYYLLTTCEKIDSNISSEINKKIQEIRVRHGCEVIVNGVFTTLKYFLRLTDSQTFLKNYTMQMEHDDALKYEHKERWNVLCTQL